MLTYHPALDTYHCFFRILYFLCKSEQKIYEVDKIRIIDFYLCSPTALQVFKFPAENRKMKKIFSEKRNEYNCVPNQNALFFEMKQTQQAVLYSLVSIGLIDSDRFRNGEVDLLRENITKELSTILDNNKSIDQDIFEFAVNSLAELPLLGKNGLKDRSGLMDHRYDLV